MDVAQNTPPLSILYVITKGTWGGAQRYVYELAIRAKAQGHVVQVACGTRGEMVERLTKQGVSIVLIPGLARDVRLGSDVRALLGLMSLIRRERPVVLHSNSSKAGFIANLAARCMGVPRILFTAHGWAWNERRPQWQRRAFKLLHLMTVLLAHKTIAVSQAVLLDASWMPGAKQRFSLVRLGVAPVELVPRAEARLFLQNTIGPTLPSSAFWIGALAELHPTKGLDVLIRAFARIKDEFPESILMLIGAGEDRGRLTALSHMLHVKTRVHFAGHIADAERILSALDLFAFPSHSEALGYALLEAGQSSLAAVASNVGGIPEIVIDGECGLLVPAGNDAVLADSVRELVKDPELRTRLGQALHNRVLTEFSRERMLEETFSLYKLS